MEQRVAVPLWDLVLVGAVFLPLLPPAVLLSGRYSVALGFLIAWSTVATIATLIGKRQGISFGRYLRSVLARDDDPAEQRGK